MADILYLVDKENKELCELIHVLQELKADMEDLNESEYGED